MKKLFAFLGIALTAISSTLGAQEVDSEKIIDYLPDVSLEMRGGYGQDFANGTGRFSGDCLYLNIDGRISPRLTYSYNQTLASQFDDVGTGFNGTNWLTLTYEIGDFSITTGKDAIFIGNFEYDASSIDSFYGMNSMFYNNIDCWQWGLSAGWYPAEDQSLLLQVANSPLAAGRPNLFAYALAWRGEWDCYESYWSTNLWQSDSKRYLKALNLGNRFHFNDFSFDLEYMTRFNDFKNAFTGDFTLLFAPSYEWNWGCATAKVGWDRVTVDDFGYDFTGNNIFYGAKLEFFPLEGRKDFRLHAQWSYNDWYTEGHQISIGVTWKLNLTEAGKQLFNKFKK